MSIQICPECNTHVENAEICPKCGYAFPQINKANVYATFAKLEAYDKRFNLYLLALIPVFGFLLLAIFVHAAFIALFIASIVATPIFFIHISKKRDEYLLEICTDKTSMINYIKQQNKNAMSIMQDKRKEGAAAYAILFTCESNPSAKRSYNTYNKICSVLLALIGIALCFIFASFFEDCDFDLPNGALFSHLSSTGGLFLISLIIEIIFDIIMVVVSKKYNKKMYTYVEEWLKAQSAPNQTNNSQRNNNTNTDTSSQNQSNNTNDDEFDLSNFDLDSL